MRRVVVTGLGAVSPCGADVPSTWSAICAGRSGIGRITAFDTTDWAVQIAGEASDFDPEAHFPRKELRRLDRFSQFALVAAREALADAGVVGPLGDRAGVYMGSGIGGIGEIEDGAVLQHERGPKGLSPFFIPKALTNLAAGHIAMEHGARGPSLCITTACATGNHSIGEAWRAIKMGDADLVVAGGAEASIKPLGMAGFMVMRALSKRNDSPETASRPFDAGRDGFVMGEGAGVLILESLESARARGARIYCELVGYGLTNDAHHITAPPEGHEGAVRCMRRALEVAGLAPEDIDYVNAHGTSTELNDREESAAIRTVFGAHADRLMVSSTKSMTGHLLGAAGGLEAVLTVQGMHTGLVPPTATLEEPGEGCDLDYVPGVAREAPVRAALSNAFGFGGTNAVLVFKALDDA